MSEMKIRGGVRLSGDAVIHGAKNSALPVLAATIAVSGRCELHNCPNLSDVEAALGILRYLGCAAEFDGGVASVDCTSVTRYDIPERLMREMRSSISFLGAILARTGSAVLSFPGGCELGPRPIDLHLSALSRMGTRIEERGGCIYCSVDGRLTGCQVPLAFPSVGATENVMVAAATAKGTTVITNAAREPEIVCLARFLNSCGARISGHGESTITVEGVDSLYGCCHTVIPDRIEAATYMAAAAVTSGEICLRRVTPAHLMPVIPVFEEMGCAVTVYDDSLIIKAPERLRPVGYVRTMPYPGFPTDCQAIVMSAACVADGTSVFVENIFDNRFKHVGELSRLGAHIKIEGRVAVVDGVRGLSGTTVDSTDLRGSAALVVAGLEADGETVVRNLHHLDRGYQQLELGLRSLGADIVRI